MPVMIYWIGIPVLLIALVGGSYLVLQATGG
jgi:hypothetical protein